MAGKNIVAKRILPEDDWLVIAVPSTKEIKKL